ATNALQQTADYIDLTRARTPFLDIRGYLVIFDGRRANVKPDTAACSREDGLAFEHAEIVYDPLLLARHDLANPVRFFCEPNWVTGRPSSRRQVA
ncbi:MAG TPA: hypothetical protein VII33_08300, partial [Nakamurella sp.]